MGEPAENLSYTELTLHTTLEASDGIISLLFDLGASGVLVEGEDPLVTLRCHFPSDDGLNKKLQAIEAYLRALEGLGIATGRGIIGTTPWEDTGWAIKWKEHFKPFRVGRCLVVKPSWEEGSGEERDLVLEIDPGMAFGTGLHGTTRMCLELLEEVMGQRSQGQGQRVLDLGTGSGILAIAAAKLGAGQVVALDLDSEACRVARENVRLNRVEDRVQVQEGSLAPAMDPFDLVVANLTTSTLLPLLSLMHFAVSPGGWLILAGILEQERPRMRQALRAEGFPVVVERTLEGWVTFLTRNP